MRRAAPAKTEALHSWQVRGRAGRPARLEGSELRVTGRMCGQ